MATTMTPERLHELATMDDDLYLQQMQDGRITRAENAGCIEWLKAECERRERNIARIDRELAQRQEVNRRLAEEYRMQTLDAEMETSRLRDRTRHLRAEREEWLIDQGVEAAKRGEDPIKAMNELRVRAELARRLWRAGYLDDQARWTAKGRKMLRACRGR